MADGFVHSTEVGAFVDGPGTRFVVFLAGCPMRCTYCHNPETWKCASGTRTSASDVLSRIARVAGFLRAGHGGVTVSGGEPLAQADFAREILAGSKQLGLHTALDTSGFLGERASDEMLDDVDLVLLDIKSWDPDTYRALTGRDIEPTLTFARRLSNRCRPAWIRFVLVPGVTDDPENMAGLARFLTTLSNIERVEVLPFHQMGMHKWQELGMPYALEHTAPPTAEELAAAVAVFENEGLPVGEGRVMPCTQEAEEGER